MKTNNFSNLWLIVVAMLAYGLTSCVNNAPPVPEAEYASKIVGHWQGTAGGEKEAMTFNDDGTFVCKVFPTGFMANTLSEGVEGTIQGNWSLSSTTITLEITGEKNVHTENRSTSSTIVDFRQNELVLKSDRGESSTFMRARDPK